MRERSVAVDSYNEGLVVFLYDDAASDRIREADPTVLEGFGEEDAADPTLMELARAGEMELARAGDLVVFELQGDGDLSIELIVGQSLTQAEIQEGGWHLPAAQARLRLESGSLRIECYDNLQFDSYTEEGEEGVVSDMPTGDYGLTLYHRDMLADEDGEKAGHSECAWRVVVLTPGEGSRMDVSAPMLGFPTTFE